MGRYEHGGDSQEWKRWESRHSCGALCVDVTEECEDYRPYTTLYKEHFHFDYFVVAGMEKESQEPQPFCCLSVELFRCRSFSSLFSRK